MDRQPHTIVAIKRRKWSAPANLKANGGGRAGSLEHPPNSISGSCLKSEENGPAAGRKHTAERFQRPRC